MKVELAETDAALYAGMTAFVDFSQPEDVQTAAGAAEGDAL